MEKLGTPISCNQFFLTGHSLFCIFLDMKASSYHLSHMNRVSRTKILSVVFLSCLMSVFVLAAILEGALRFGIIENEQYYRWQTPKKPKYRLLILGDSFIIPRSALAKSLARDLVAQNVSVLNAAISGTGPFEYLAEMKAMGMNFKPDVVLLSYYVGNDLTNVQNHPQFNPKKTGVAIDSRTSQSFGRSLYLYHYVLRNLRMARLRLRPFDYEKAEASGISPELIEDAKKLRINPWLVNLALEETNYFLDNLLMETDDNMKSWEKAKQLLADIHDLCNSLHSQMMVVIFPGSIQVNDSHFEFYKKLTFNLDGRTLESTKPQRLLMDFCAGRNIACLDLLPAFKARKEEEFYQDKDDHLNEKGSHVAGQLILDFLLRNSIIGKDK